MRGSAHGTGTLGHIYAPESHSGLMSIAVGIPRLYRPPQRLHASKDRPVASPLLSLAPRHRKDLHVTTRLLGLLTAVVAVVGVTLGVAGTAQAATPAVQITKVYYNSPGHRHRL